MNSKLNPYIGFNGNARDAMEFYKSVFGGNLHMMTFKDLQMSQNPIDDNKIMHSQLDVDNGITLMGADAPEGMDTSEGSRITISLSGDNEAELRDYWDRLTAGANITQPLEAAPWGDTFGMLTDKYGVNWMVNIAGKQA